MVRYACIIRGVCGRERHVPDDSAYQDAHCSVASSFSIDGLPTGRLVHPIPGITLKALLFYSFGKATGRGPVEERPIEAVEKQ